MQLTLDHISGPGTSILNIYEKWAMLDFLDRRCNQTGLMIYEEEDYRFRVPFQIGELNFSSCSEKLVGHQLRLTHWSSKYSSVFLKHILTSLIESEFGYKAIYAQEVGSGKERALVGNQAGKAYFFLRDYPTIVTRFPNIESSFDKSDAFQALIGATVHLKLRVNQDWVQEITSIPFVIENIGLQGNEITITGSNDTELTIKGFKGIRINPASGYIIFDVFDEVNGYSRSFQLMSRKSR